MTHFVQPLPQGSTPASLTSTVSAVIQQAQADQRLVGAVVLVARHGKLIYQQAFGLADRENGRPMALDTVFRLASVTKPIVSAAALVLVAQGKLELDSPVERWLPEFRPTLADGHPATITVRQLLSHTAGLNYGFSETAGGQDYARAGVSDGLDASDVSLAENLRRIASVPLLYHPGTSWNYSLATDVLGALIAAVQGVPLPQAVEQLVTGPLGMSDSAFIARDPLRVAVPYVNDTPQPHRLAEGERVPFDEVTEGVHFSPARIFNASAYPSGGAGMAGTAGDVLRLLEALRAGRGELLPEALVKEMERDHTCGRELPEMPGFGFGLGFAVVRNAGLTGMPLSNGSWRWGGVYGHSWFVDRTQGLSVVALTNTLYEGMDGQFVTDLREAVYSGLRDEDVKPR